MAPLFGNVVANNRTADSAQLKTWWHDSGEINTKTPVQSENVRQSHLYSVQVGLSSNPTDLYDSFVYESIPRNGNGNIFTPGDLDSVCDGTNCSEDDQISIEPDIGVDMAWTQYLSAAETVIRITRSDNGSIDPDDVIIRPSNLTFDKSQSENALFITIPYSENGHRFSVEFRDNLWEYRNAGPGTGSHYVQNKTSSGLNYVEAYDDTMPIVGVEPLNALMIFMSPFPRAEYIPDIDSAYHVPAGLVTGLDHVTESVVYFSPGVYWLTGSAHAILSSSVTWVYIAPGAYIKGAIEYTSDSLDLRATGFGVLSGEQYVYQANTAMGYQNIKNDTTCLKMWRGQSAVGTHWTLHGLTLNAPPFNSMDFYGDDLSSFSVDASDYKQVGAFFGQTDGIQMYPGSHVHDVFYHVGDDAIKTYYGDVLCERVTVWKTNNAPIVQFGWYPRTTDNVTVDAVNVIHTRYMSQEEAWPRALVASAASYEDSTSHETADVSKHLSNYRISNWRCEGICPALLGINPLENIDNVTFSNIQIETLSPATTEVGMSEFRVFTDSNGNAIALGDNSSDGLGLIIEDFYVGDQKISYESGNWDATSLGHLNIDKHYEGHWTIR
ncbi:Dex49a from penicillium Minioluteum complex with isomaltose [Thelonectria olida]|uniref:Dex49a from penicillium Minioluteum complex with isomaltose n=1 Tax=Thelonectria olida TaxID=1576542 RepID=A0A9P9AIS7_9HYPO|nr:Dex49a from penicillium Minioluteum complex with isomaltose [Thelonectria olida]